jgi:sulfide:quinone oxidoreductase
MTSRVLVLGAGFGGLELSTRLSQQLGDEVEVILIDHADSSMFGFSKLDVMFGRTTADAVRHPYADLVKPDVRFVNNRSARSIRCTARSRPTPAASRATCSSSPSGRT